jgi:hypothetical protein
MPLRSWFRRRRATASTDQPRADPPPLPDGGAGHVVLTWKYEDDLEGDEGIGPVWVARYAARDASEPATVVEWDEWVPFTEARDHALSRGYEFNEG